jgi:hypothetical protein
MRSSRLPVAGALYILRAYHDRTTLSRSELKSLRAGEFEIGEQTVWHHALLVCPPKRRRASMVYRTGDPLLEEQQLTSTRPDQEAMLGLVEQTREIATSVAVERAGESRGGAHHTFVNLGYSKVALPVGLPSQRVAITLYDRGHGASKDGLSHCFAIKEDGSCEHSVLNPFESKRGYVVVWKGRGEDQIVDYLRSDLGPGNGQPPPLSYLKKRHKGLGNLDFVLYLRQLGNRRSGKK